MYYDRPLKQIIAEDALKEMPNLFTAQDMFEWIHARYPNFKLEAVRKHLLGMSANHPNKGDYRTSRSMWRDRILKVGRNQYRKRP